MPTNIYISNAPHITAEESYDEVKKLMYPKGAFGIDVLECPDYIEVTFKQEIISTGATVVERVAISTASILSFGEINETRFERAFDEPKVGPNAPGVEFRGDGGVPATPIEADAEAMINRMRAEGRINDPEHEQQIRELLVPSPVQADEAMGTDKPGDHTPGIGQFRAETADPPRPEYDVDVPATELKSRPDEDIIE